MLKNKLLFKYPSVSFCLLVFILFLAPGISADAQEKMQVQTRSLTKELMDQYPIESGHLRLAPYQSLFFNMTTNEVRTDTIHLLNAWGSSMQILFRELPAFLKITPVPQMMSPFSEGYLLVTYDAAARNDFDMVVDNISIFTNDTIETIKRLEIMAVIGDDYTGYTLRDLRNAPLATLSADTFNFGTVEQGSVVRYQLEVLNQGKDTLAIRKIKSSCGCTTGEPDRRLVPPGESAGIDISFNTYGREGYHAKSVTIYTNDPEHIRLEFTIGGIILKK
jgi:hypothetical protein